MFVQTRRRLRARCRLDAGVVQIHRTGQAARLVDLPAGAVPIRDHLRPCWAVRLSPPRHSRNHRGSRRYMRSTSGVARRGGERVHRTSKAGMTVAPSSFGRFGGDLIAAERTAGVSSRSVTTCGKDGRRVGRSRRAGCRRRGARVVPQRVPRSGSAYVSDLGAPGSPTVGTDGLLMCRVRSSAAGDRSRRSPRRDQSRRDHDLDALRGPMRRAPYRRRPRGNPRRGAYRVHARLVIGPACRRYSASPFARNSPTAASVFPTSTPINSRMRSLFMN